MVLGSRFLVSSFLDSRFLDSRFLDSRFLVSRFLGSRFFLNLLILTKTYLNLQYFFQALRINVNGVSEILTICKQMKKLEALVNIRNIFIKLTLSVLSTDSPCKDGKQCPIHTKVPLKSLSDQ